MFNNFYNAPTNFKELKLKQLSRIKLLSCTKKKDKPTLTGLYEIETDLHPRESYLKS